MYLAEDTAEAAVLLDKAIAGCRNDSNGPTEALNLSARHRARVLILAHHDTGAKCSKLRNPCLPRET